MIPKGVAKLAPSCRQEGRPRCGREGGRARRPAPTPILAFRARGQLPGTAGWRSFSILTGKPPAYQVTAPPNPSEPCGA